MHPQQLQTAEWGQDSTGTSRDTHPASPFHLGTHVWRKNLQLPHGLLFLALHAKRHHAILPTVRHLPTHQVQHHFSTRPCQTTTHSTTHISMDFLSMPPKVRKENGHEIIYDSIWVIVDRHLRLDYGNYKGRYLRFSGTRVLGFSSPQAKYTKGCWEGGSIYSKYPPFL